MRSPGLRNAFDVHTHLGIVAVFVLLDVEGIKELHGSESKVDLTITEFLMVGNALSMEIDLRSDSSSDANIVLQAVVVAIAGMMFPEIIFVL